VRLHLIALPHAHVSRDVTVCAFTTKTAKFLKMMGERGHELVLYGGELSEVGEYAELVVTYTDLEQKLWYGDMDANTLPIVAGSWDANQESYKVTNQRAISALKKRYETGDIVLLTGGLAQKPIFDALTPRLVVEWAAGYSGMFAPAVCFESYAWRHYCYGRYGMHWGASDTGRWFDTVIPNFFDPDEWSLHPKEDYLVFVGRLIERKGPHVAAMIARELGLPLRVAGSGVHEVSEGLIVCQDGTRLEGDVHYEGTVGWEARNELMGRARALIAPTTYVEPFGAVVVESMLCGTPSIATDWGAFTETLPPERRFRTLAEGIDAVSLAMELDPYTLHEQALARWSLEAIAPMYERWFAELDTLWTGGWYELPAIR
jgi:glycosyltransferase involved in cell wall biosynthesis